MRKLLSSAAAAAALVPSIVLSAALAGSASAAPPERGTFRDDYGPDPSFCGDQFTLAGFVEGSFLTRTKGGFDFTSMHTTGTDTWTNSATGESLFVDTRSNSLDVHITPGGDGTYTVVYQAAGTSVARTADGTVLDRSAGLNRLSLTFDDNGTPGDQSDDEVIDVQVLLSAGSRYDICALVERTLG